MAKDVIDKAVSIGKLEKTSSLTKILHIHGYHQHAEIFKGLEQYGSDAPSIKIFLNENPEYNLKLHPDYAYVEGEVIWSVQHEMARTVEDFLARRTRLLFLDAKASIVVAEKVARIMVKALHQEELWIANQVEAFNQLAAHYYL